MLIYKNNKQSETINMAKKKSYENQYLLKSLGLITFSCMYDDDWSILFINNLIYKICGYTNIEVSNNNLVSFNELIHKDYRDYVREEIKKAIINNSIWDIDYLIIHKDGSTKWINEKGHALLNKKGKVDHLEGVIIDISKYKSNV